MSREDQHNQHLQSETEIVGGPSNGPVNKKEGKKTTRFNIPDSGTTSTDVPDDSVAVRSVIKTANGVEEDLEMAKGEKRSVSSTPSPLVRTKSAAAHALGGLKFISRTDGGEGWAAVEKRFDEITASTNGLLPRARFCECIGMEKSKNFAEELFNALARKRKIEGDSISKDELKEFWEQISDQSFNSRLQTFFDMVDKDDDGRLTEDEVREIISLSASANRLENIQEKAGEYAALIMRQFDPENHGHIMIEDLEMLLMQEPNGPAGIGESKSLSRMITKKLEPTISINPLKRWFGGTNYFLLDNWQRVWVMALWIGVMAGLFAYKYVQYRNRAAYKVMGACVCMAKGAAETLKLNMALILLPVCRNTITWLRNKTKSGVVVPFDDNLNFHQMIAVAIALGVGIHAISHLACDFPRLIHASEEKWKLMEPFFGDQPSDYWHFVKSVEGVTGIIMVVLMAIAFTLASPWFRRNELNLCTFLKKLTGFNAFWYSHHLFIIVYTLLIVHGQRLYLTHDWYKKTTWMYLAIPLILYAGERFTRALRSRIEAVDIVKVGIYPGGVLALQMTKPSGFRYESGQYMFVKCAAVSPFEWHPFSITSAPGDDYLSVHIRALGDWTTQIGTVFKACQPTANGPLSDHKPKYPRVKIDGPYGAPAQDYKKYEAVLLIGLGIGATPMISIVKDILSNIRAIEEEENALENGLAGIGNSPSKEHPSPNAQNREKFKTRKAYFYWQTSQQGSFDWFKGVMNEVAEMDHKGVIELHNYCTCVFEEGDARSAFITMLQSLHHAKNGVDIISGTRVKSHFSKPSWHNVYEQIARNHTHAEVGVFYCGPAAVTKKLRQLALDFSHNSSTKFDFHKENF